MNFDENNSSLERILKSRFFFELGEIIAWGYLEVMFVDPNLILGRYGVLVVEKVGSKIVNRVEFLKFKTEGWEKVLEILSRRVKLDKFQNFEKFTIFFLYRALI